MTPPAPDPALEAAVRREGFAALLGGRALTLLELAEAAGVGDEVAEAVVSALVRSGRATLTPDGRLDGIAGVTARPSRHAIERPGREPIRTWCAFDAVAIPAALGWTATAATTCGRCGCATRVEIEDGVPAGAAWVWLPPADCEHVLRDFCAAADLYCSREHLDAWRAGAGDPPGEGRPVAELVELARTGWADCDPPAGA
jgi:hypothetical protein